MILLDFLPPELDLTSEDGMEAVIQAHCGHRHLTALMAAHDKVAGDHALKHFVDLLSNVEDFDACDKVHAFLDWAEEKVERGKAAFYN